MFKVELTGRLLPKHLLISAKEIPSLDWKWLEEDVNLRFSYKIENSLVSVICELDKYKPSFPSEIHKRAIDLVRVAANMVTFNTGYGLTVILEMFIDPYGNQLPLHRQEIIQPEFRSSFSLEPEKSYDFNKVLCLVLTEPQLFMALDDLNHALISQHTQVADCGRVIDRIRRTIDPTLDGATGWKKMQKELNISKSYQEWVTRLSTGSRHGDSTPIPPDVCREALKRTWAILNRFLEYRKAGNQALEEPDFPLLF